MIDKELVNKYKNDHATYEKFNQLTIPVGDFAIRLDGRAFSKLTEGMNKPFDNNFQRAIEKTAEALMNEFVDAYYCYCQSDELTILLSAESQFFARRVEKIISIAAATATMTFNKELSTGALFDARILTTESKENSWAMLAERQSDARKNALSNLAYWTLRHQGKSKREATRQLQGLDGKQRTALLRTLDINIADISEEFVMGHALIRETYPHEGYNPKTGEKTLTERKRLRWQKQLPDFTKINQPPWQL